jgi:small conductance mechanosensitive channel
MLNLDSLMDKFIIFLPPLLTLIVVCVVIWAFHWFLIGRNPHLGNERKFPRQIILLGLMIAGLLTIAFTLPINEGSRNQLIGLIGLLISGIIAFSSTSIVSNLMAGILLRITRPFRTGDFIRVADHFGRVSERGLFDTEIQTETRELIALPNTFLITNAVTTIRSSGTIISATVSLGYDAHHSQVESSLIKAAEKCGLEEPFVHILELGNFAVTYRISGLLTEVKRLITARSNLYQNILDTLHDRDIEIMSPNIMNQRRIPDDKKVIPIMAIEQTPEEKVNAEEIAFDKAEAAEIVDKAKQDVIKEIEELEAAINEASEDTKSQIKERIEECRKYLKTLDTDVSNTEQIIAEKITPADANRSRR